MSLKMRNLFGDGVEYESATMRILNIEKKTISSYR
jgi:hypothetical protein